MTVARTIDAGATPGGDPRTLHVAGDTHEHQGRRAESHPERSPRAATLSHSLSLQALPLELDTPSDTRHSTNSIYVCMAVSHYSVGC